MKVWRGVLVGAVTTASLIGFGSAVARQQLADEWLAKPVDDKTFKTYLDFFTYDRRVPFDLRAEGHSQMTNGSMNQ